MPGVFVSYRHEDARADAGRLVDDLSENLNGVRAAVQLQSPVGVADLRATVVNDTMSPLWNGVPFGGTFQRVSGTGVAR